MKRNVLFLVGVLVVLIYFLPFVSWGGGAPPTDARIAVLPEPKAGSWWILKTNGGENKIELLRVENDKFIIRETRYGEREVSYTREWGVLESRNFRGTWQTHDPPIKVLSFPLWENKKWMENAGWTQLNGEGKSGYFSVWGKAGGWETVDTPAGTFESVKVTVHIGNFVRADCWYSPVVSRIVKCRSDDPSFSYVLLRYHLVV